MNINFRLSFITNSSARYQVRLLCVVCRTHKIHPCNRHTGFVSTYYI